MWLAGCAAGGEAGGGGTDLPNRGFAPYEVQRDGDAGLLHVVEGAVAPRATVEGDRVVLRVEACEGEVCADQRWVSRDGLEFEADGVVEAAEQGDRGFFVRDGAVWRGAGGAETEVFTAQDEGWEKEGISGAEVRVEATATGRELYRMVYAGVGGGVGFAASVDGVTWSRFAFNPVLEERARGVSNVRFGDRYLLYLGLGRGAGFVVVALDEAGAASSDF